MPHDARGRRTGHPGGSTSVRSSTPPEAGRGCSSWVAGRFCARRCGRSDLLAERFGVAADVWSATSYKELCAATRSKWSAGTVLHPDEPARKPYVVAGARAEPGPIVAVSDYMRIVPDQIARWLPGRFFPLGTDGFGRSDTREALRRFFEIDAESVAVAALHQLALRGDVRRPTCRARRSPTVGLDAEKPFALAV